MAYWSFDGLVIDLQFWMIEPLFENEVCQLIMCCIFYAEIVLVFLL